jgi:hypothetical protein
MKTGRPRKPDAERKPGGRVRSVPSPSGATDELQARIEFYTGGSKRGNAESPMGILVARCLVDEALREKVTTPYMRAMKKCFGSYGPAVPGDGTERGHDSSSDDGGEAAARSIIRRCDKVLNRLQFESSRKIFDDFVVRETFPVWMAYTPSQRTLTLDTDYNIELKLILRILEMLAKEFQIRPERQHAHMVSGGTTVVRNYQQAEVGVD